jgi:hypothetical protein
MKSVLICAALLATVSFGESARAANLVKNGDFSLTTGGQSGTGQFIPTKNVNGNTNPTSGNKHSAYAIQITDWNAVMASTNQYSPFLFVQQATKLASTGFPDSWDSGYKKLWGPIGAPPDGDTNVLVMDADYDVTPIFQVITPTSGHLVNGATYTLTFDYAQAQWTNGTTNTTSGLEVAFGGHIDQISTTALTKETFGGWKTATMTFTYNASNSSTMTYSVNNNGHTTFTSPADYLTFIAEGTPQGDPPTILLSGVSLTGPVPEPAVWTMMICGVAGVGGALRRRRRALYAGV